MKKKPKEPDLVSQFFQTLKRTGNPSDIRDKVFKPQDAFVLDANQRIAALCTRRAGKTNGLALRFIRTMLRYPGQTCRYIALTRESAADIMWPVLQEVNDRFNLGAQFYISKLVMELPNRAKLRLYGADMKNFVRRLKGVKSPAVAVDEAQDFGDHLGDLVETVIEPTLADFHDSWLAVTGTPGPLPRGYFYDITTGGRGDYKLHKWSLYDNPYMPDPKGFVEKIKTQHKWDDRHPTLLREYFGQWVLDMESLLIRYSAAKNHFDELPTAHYNHILGVDIGHRDADALAVLAWSESSPNIYLVYEEVTRGQDITTLAESIERLVAKYNPSKIVMDTGALGLKIAEEFRRRRHIPVYEADKKRKWENVAFLNDYLGQQKFYARADSNFASDSYQVQIDYERSTPDRLVVRAGFHSDIIDAVLYAFRESPAYTWRPAEEKPKHGTKGWMDAEVQRMEREAEEFMESLDQGTVSDEEFAY